MRLLFGLACASIIFSGTAFAQTAELDQLRQASKDAYDESRHVCASANEQVDAYRRDHRDNFRSARTPQEAGQIINDMNAHIAELKKPCMEADAKANQAGRNLLVGTGAFLSAMSEKRRKQQKD
jgi:hypothetical protein